MDKVVLRRALACCLALALGLGLLGLLVSDAWSSQQTSQQALARSAITGLSQDGDVVQQGLSGLGTHLDSLTLYLAASGAAPAGALQYQLLTGGEVVFDRTIDLAAAEGDSLTLFFGGVEIPGEALLRLTFHDPAGLRQLPALWVGDSVDTGRLTVAAAGLDSLSVNGTPLHARLCMQVESHSPSGIMGWYWPISLALVLLCVGMSLRAARRAAKGQPTWLTRLDSLWQRYAFLLEQLVKRNFSTKYRQSVLGVLWSFLNPLLTMAVQYVVFSTLFRSAIPNFPVYLTCGIVLFNFFTESANLGLESIVANGPLLTKVAMPKYIFPLSRTLSALMNLLISLIPLLLMMLITRVRFTWALLLSPWCILFLTCFALGMALLLSVLYAFFRDVKFLWSVVVLLWTYATPIFYPETILPAVVLPIYRLNPMYQFITFLRTLVLDGQVPGPAAFLSCALSGVLPLLAGILVFRRQQDELIMRL